MAVGQADEQSPLYLRLAGILPAALFVWLLSMVPSVSQGGEHYWAVEWLPQLGIALSLRVDGLSLLFGLLITGIGSFILLYATGYMRGARQLGRFTLFLVSFMLSMLGLVLSDNLIALFVFWELTTVTSFLLIGYSHEDPVARRSALQGLLVTGAGALAMLAGFVLLGHATGTYSLREMLSEPGGLPGHPHYAAILVLILAGAFTKSAQFPFHFWLPNAMAAPTPVSAYLHSATMVKAGVFLLARLSPVLGDTEAWTVALTVTGAVTAVYSSAVAFTKTDLKQILAYTTVMALGICVMFIGLPAAHGHGEPHLGMIAAITFVFIHALYKAALFMVAGTIDHSAGTRDLRLLGGLRKVMPWTFAAALLAALSMAGMPPFIGFIGKELLYESAIASPEALFAAVAAVAANAMVVAAAILVVAVPFGGEPRESLKSTHEGGWTLWIGSLVLGVVALAAGLVPQPVFDSLLLPAAGAAIGSVPEFKAGLWHGVNLPLLLSVATVTAGVLLFWQRSIARRGLERGLALTPVTGDRAYEAAMDGIARFSVWQTRRLQCGIQRRYLLTAFAVLGLSLAITLVVKDAVVLPSAIPDANFIDWALAALISVAALITVRARSRLLAICALGVAGTGTALIFLVYGAVDVAMTQLMVETLVVVIVAMVLLKLPGFRNEVRQSRPGRWRDRIVAATVGVSVTSVLLSVTSSTSERSLTDRFTEIAYPEGFGRNVVNVILVDFRGFDTMGEITVLAIAAIAGYGLIQWKRSAFDRARKDQAGRTDATAETGLEESL